MSWAAVANRLASTAIYALGNEVTISGTTSRGILRSPSESVFDGVLILTDWMLEVPIETWSAVAEGTSITVDGVAFVAREQGRINPDGSSVMVPLEPVTGGLTTLAGAYLVTVSDDYIITQ